ncbi:fatty acid desaturase [Xylophilus sp. GOD-11R]|uniref:fatty acid desaturase n=1 Tax=Xylophilus sp. GOD-11R TaxID=3089814 RepID=UPI00298D4C40|nr:fatty acid desaturase [Xylophilus sp. GOD-11R]WPB59209.1 fatty acid desaturase [Xylophilus sp. GOD-11R]
MNPVASTAAPANTLRHPRSSQRAAAAWWRRCEAPTVVLALAFYPAWAALLWWHASLPGWLLFAMGGYVAQLHFSLQHESIHAMRGMPRWLRLVLVWPPVNLWLPYPLYVSGHSSHHVNFHLTHPRRDTESAYHSAQAWHDYGRWRRMVYVANQTLAFRMLLGPFLRIHRLLADETRRVARRDFTHVPAWVWHAVSVAPLLCFVTVVCDMPFWKYLLFFVYPAMMLGNLRSFTEHRWSESPHARVAIVESNAVMGLLFLFNNLHHVHHRAPTMPWYEIPGYFRRHRTEVLAANGNFYWRGYGQIARRHLFRPVFRPVHPVW